MMPWIIIGIVIILIIIFWIIRSGEGQGCP